MLDYFCRNRALSVCLSRSRILSISWKSNSKKDSLSFIFTTKIYFEYYNKEPTWLVGWWWSEGLRSLLKRPRKPPVLGILAGGIDWCPSEPIFIVEALDDETTISADCEYWSVNGSTVQFSFFALFSSCLATGESCSQLNWRFNLKWQNESQFSSLKNLLVNLNEKTYPW